MAAVIPIPSLPLASLSAFSAADLSAQGDKTGQPFSSEQDNRQAGSAATDARQLQQQGAQHSGAAAAGGLQQQQQQNEAGRQGRTEGEIGVQRQGDGQGDAGRGKGGEGEKQGGERRSGDGASAQEQQRGLLEGDRKDERGVDQQDGLRQKGAGVMDQQQMMVSLSFPSLIFICAASDTAVPNDISRERFPEERKHV